MRVLIAGGLKTQNIVDGIARKFSAGGIDFIVAHNIEDVSDLYAKGEYFDRALIIEQSWNHDFTSTEEYLIRQRLSTFVQDSISSGNLGATYIFLTQTVESAAMTYEEILNVRNDSVVVVKEPLYSVNFFVSLITCDIEKFPEDIIYKPLTIDDSTGQKEIEAQDDGLNYDIQSIEDLSKDLFESCDDEDTLSSLFDNTTGIFETIPDKCIETQADQEALDQEALDQEALDQEMTVQDQEDTTQDQEETTQDQEEQEVIDQDEFDIEQEAPTQDQEEIDQALNQDISDGVDLSDYTVDDNIGSSFDDYEEELSDDAEANQADLISQPFNDETEEVKHDEISSKPEDANKYDDKSIKSKSNTNESTYDNTQAKQIFDVFAARGNSIVMTGCGGCGTSSIAYNLANTICNIGYNVLLVDLDTVNRTQAYISKNSNECIEPDGANVMAALNSTSGIGTYVSIIKPGFHLLTMGLAGDVAKLSDIIHKEKFDRFINLAKSSYDFVIYDVPFTDLVGCASDLVFMTDNIVITVDSSNWGITKFMTAMCNIESEDVQDVIFSRGQTLYNRYKGFHKIMGKKIKSVCDIAAVMDDKVHDLLQEEPEYNFRDMHVCGIMQEDPDFEMQWYNKKAYSDSEKGREIFIDMLKSAILKK